MYNIVFNIRFFAHISIHFTSISCVLSSLLICFIYSFIYVCLLFSSSFFLPSLSVAACTWSSVVTLHCVVFHCLLFIVYFWFLLHSNHKMFHISHFHCVLHVSFHVPFYFRIRIQFIYDGVVDNAGDDDDDALDEHVFFDWNCCICNGGAKSALHYRRTLLYFITFHRTGVCGCEVMFGTLSIAFMILEDTLQN